MKVTIVVRTYNRPEFLKEALASVELQNHKDWELILFDDSASELNFEIYKNFKDKNPNNRVMYLTTKSSRELFADSWILSIDLSKGDIIVRLDDDDILSENSLSFLSKLYTENPELDFSYGSCIKFEGEKLVELVESFSPNQIAKTTTAWLPYTIPNNSPWHEPHMFVENFYPNPENYTSIIHCSKANILCSYHTYVMRTTSLKKIKDKLSVTARFADDLEMMGTMDYLGLGHSSVKKILSYVRIHNEGRVTDLGTKSDGINIYQEIFGIRNKVDRLRPSGFMSKIIPLYSDSNHNNGINDLEQDNFTKYLNLVKMVKSSYGD